MAVVARCNIPNIKLDPDPEILPIIVVLFVKPIVLTFAIISVALLTQLFLLLDYPRGNSFAVDRLSAANLIQAVILDRTRSSMTSEYFADRFSPKKSPLNQAKKHMKIKFRQSGGYAGLRMGCDLDTKLLSPEEATQLESLVNTSGVLQANGDRSENAADLISYEISIETNQGTHQVTFDDLTLPENVLPLLDYLQSRAKPLR
jgi:hypothetical protein